jgi:hypothetical protein
MFNPLAHTDRFDMYPHSSLPPDAPARLFSDLIKALHDESEALIANDSAGLANASGRKEHLLRLLAPQASALRAMRQGGSDELERFAREAAQLRMFAS